MKIVGLNVFLALPAGTVYFNYIEHNFDLGGTPALMIKGETLGDGFYEATCVSTDVDLDVLVLLGQAAKNGKSFLLNPRTEKFDGTFRDEQLYADYEPTDAVQLITRLMKAFGQSGLADKALVNIVDQAVSAKGYWHYETPIFAPGSPEPHFVCTNLHTGEKHHLTQDEAGELLETGVAPTRPNNWGQPTPDAPRIQMSKEAEEACLESARSVVDKESPIYKAAHAVLSAKE